MFNLFPSVICIYRGIQIFFREFSVDFVLVECDTRLIYIVPLKNMFNLFVLCDLTQLVLMFYVLCFYFMTISEVFFIVPRVFVCFRGVILHFLLKI